MGNVVRHSNPGTDELEVAIYVPYIDGESAIQGTFFINGHAVEVKTVRDYGFVRVVSDTEGVVEIAGAS